MTSSATSAHAFTLTANDGTTVPMSSYAGKVVLVVNVASRCGFTKQYSKLEALYQAKSKDGLVIVAIPANEFGGQEPGDDAAIRNFCTTKFQVTFPLMAKSVAKGPGIHPLFAWLTTNATPKGDIKWNFTKFLIGADGALRGRFESAVEPDAKELTAAIDAALAAAKAAKAAKAASGK